MFSLIRQTTTKAKPLVSAMLDIAFPPRCPSCRILVMQQGALCPDCWQLIKFISAPLCDCCGLPLPYAALNEQLCTRCLQERPEFSRARSSMQYDEHSKRMLLGLKYYDRTSLVPTLTRFLQQGAKDILPACDLIIPVPMPWKRLWWRKYNQAALLGKELARTTKLPLHTDILIRRKDTPPQSGLTRKQRLENMRGAFAVSEKGRAFIKDKVVLVVDDTMTTGATLDACAKTLLKAGAKEVRAATVARTVLAT